jgi:UDP-N-acetylmuramoyl-tripeptide--D-alanyl-D-alanine ligase
MMNPQTIAQILGSECHSDLQTMEVELSIDSRTIKPGSIYLALKGERFDGHAFIDQALQQGAVAVIAEKSGEWPVPQFVVGSGIEALSRLAASHRQQITCPVIALTGSNGKTTVKEMIATILPKPSLASQGNYNNHIGVPLSILKLKKTDRYAVFELGANHMGEIAYTAAMVKPDVALITNIAPAHIEGFGSIDNVAKTKGELYEALGQNGVAVINDDDDYAHFWDHLPRVKQGLRFSLKGRRDVYLRDVSWNTVNCAQFTLCLPSGEGQVTLQIPGRHSMQNALAAAASCYAAGIDLPCIIEGLQQFKGVHGRLQFLSGKNQSTVIDDTYNANLQSALTAVDVLAEYKGQRIFVLGDMGELGALTQQHHEEVGKAVLSRGIDLLMTCGRHSIHAGKAFGAEAMHYSSRDVLAQDLLRYLDKNTTVLVKGSRAAGMEKIVHQLID